MKPKSDRLSIALEELRNRPIVAESREYARRWERGRARAASLRGVVLGPVGAVAAACAIACIVFGLLPVEVIPSSLQSLTTRNLIETGIGETRAQAIIANRPYESVDDLERVPGIGPATLEELRPHVVVE